MPAKTDGDGVQSKGAMAAAVAAAASGPLGVLGMLVAGLGELGFLYVPKEGNVHGWAIIGGALVGASLWWQNHRTLRMAATIGASSEISRAKIATALDPANPVVPTSPDPAVQRAIQKQIPGDGDA